MKLLNISAFIIAIGVAWVSLNGESTRKSPVKPDTPRGKRDFLCPFEFSNHLVSKTFRRYQLRWYFFCNANFFLFFPFWTQFEPGMKYLSVWVCMCVSVWIIGAICGSFFLKLFVSHNRWNPKILLFFSPREWASKGDVVWARRFQKL